MDRPRLGFDVLKSSAMLIGLTVRDVVLVDQLELHFKPGLNVLTGETGAGKSIVLDALGLALGARGDSGLVREGAAQAVVSAEFALANAAPVTEILREQGLAEDARLVLRRTLGADGRSRAFANDQAVSVGLLRALGEALVEVHGTNDQSALLDTRTHRAMLDAFAGLDEAAAAVAAAWRAWRQAAGQTATAADDLERARAEEDYLRHALSELDALAPEAGEEERLAEERALLMHGEKLGEGLAAADDAVSGDGGAAQRLVAAERALERLAERAAGRLEAALTALARAAGEVAEAGAVIEALRRDLDFDPRRLEAAEERLFALRAMARKHRVGVDRLPLLRAELAVRLGTIDDGAVELQRLRARDEEGRARFRAAARALSTGRREAARSLDAAVAMELEPLKLGQARFQAEVDTLPEEAWGAYGADRVSFQVATNPGASPGPLSRVASGGELSRFLLALKVVLARARTASTLIFDEVDRGVGGATAQAVGERLKRLSGASQVLVVTHSPQVAAAADHHWRVEKRDDGRTLTVVEELGAEARREEIARMLAGAQVTHEARAAAESLIAGGRP